MFLNRCEKTRIFLKFAVMLANCRYAVLVFIYSHFKFCREKIIHFSSTLRLEDMEMEDPLDTKTFIKELGIIVESYFKLTMIASESFYFDTCFRTEWELFMSNYHEHLRDAYGCVIEANSFYLYLLKKIEILHI